MSTTSVNSLTGSSPPSLPSLNIKLVEKNYAYWRSQVLPTLKAYELDGYISGDSLCPSMFVVEKSEGFEVETVSKKPNPLYFTWKRVDQFLVSWLLATISETMFRHVAKCTSAYEIWKTLELHFQSVSKTRTLHLRNLLQTTKKEAMCINDYILRMKELGDELISSGVVISDEELLLYILDGLGSEFDVVVAILTANSREVTIQEAQFLLQKHELRLERHHSIASDQLAFVATKNHVSEVEGFKSVQPGTDSSDQSYLNSISPHFGSGMLT